MFVLAQPQFHDEAKAYEFVESIIWPEGPVCPHCQEMARISKMQGKSTRIGAYKCYACRKPFTVKIGSIFEASHVPMHMWLQAIYLMCSSKKGISSNQLARTLGIQVRSAWFLSHRIREALRSGDLDTPMGGNGGVVEADETFIGRKVGQKPKGQKKGRGYAHKHAVLSLVERGGDVRSFHIDRADTKTVMPIVRDNIAKEARIMTDEAGYYLPLGREFAEHGVVRHGAGEYVMGDTHTNTLEGYFSIFKRGMKGVYQHCGEKHLHRYLAEFDFRYNNRVRRGIDDEARTVMAIRGVVGKRLKYRSPETT